MEKHTIMASTEEIYKNSDITQFYGKYIGARKKMDYQYYSNYTEERQYLQDKIIDLHLINKVAQKLPWIIYTCGCYGAGKTHTLKGLKLYKETDVHIDPDKIKYMLPETKVYIQENSVEFNKKVQKEATFIASLIENYSLEKNYSITIDGSLHDYIWFTSYFDYLRHKHGHYRIGIIKVNASFELIKERCIKRGKETGRVIPVDILTNNYNKTEISFEKLKKYADMYFVVTNNNDIVINMIDFNGHNV